MAVGDGQLNRLATRSDSAFCPAVRVTGRIGEHGG